MAVHTHPQPALIEPRRESRDQVRRVIVAAGMVVALGLAYFSGTVLIPLALLLSGLLLAWPAERDQDVERSRWNLLAGVIAAVSVVALVGLFAPLVFQGLVHRWFPLALAALVLLAVVPMLCAVALRSRSEEDSRGPVTLSRRDLVLSISVLVALVFAHESASSFLVIATLVFLLPIVFVVRRLFLGRLGRLETGLLRDPLRPDLRMHWLQVLNTWLLCALLAVVPATGAFDALGVSGHSLTTFDLFYWLALLVLALLPLVPLQRVQLASNLLRFALSLALAVTLAVVFRTPDDVAAIGMPLSGRWHVVHGGHAELVNAHAVTGFEADALDLLRQVHGQSYRGDTQRLSSYYAYGAPVVAPASGTVTQVVSHRPDEAIGSSDIDHPAGNFVIIGIGAGRYVVLAHLRPGSLRVVPGQHVAAGQRVASVGNSGNTSEPHLHLQVQDRPTLDFPDVGDVRTVPPVFRGVTVLRNGGTSTPAFADLRRGDDLWPAR
ncbi:MAG: M23 family metallopeptidase [Nocardioidaceae bacterium]